MYGNTYVGADMVDKNEGDVMEVRERMYDQSHKSVIFLRKAQWRPVSETMLIHRDPLGAALSM